MANPFTSAKAPSGQPGIAMQIIAPELAARQIQNARLQQLAQYLFEKGNAEDEQTQVIGGWAMPQSSLKGLSKVAQIALGALMQYKGDKSTAEIQKAYADKLVQNATGQAAPGAAPPVSPGVASDTPTSDAAIPPPASGATGQPPTTPAGPPVGAPTNNGYSLGKLIQGASIEEIGGDNAAKTYWQDNAKTDTQKTNEYLGIDKETARRNALAKAVVEGTQNMRAGSTIRMPDGTFFTAPDQDSGVMTNWKGASPSLNLIPGARDVLSIKSQAAQEGKNRATPASTDLLVRNPDGTYAPKTVDQVINPSVGSTPQNGIEPSGLPSKLVDNIIGIESGGNPNAVNPQSGAQGLGQFMPSTVKMLNDKGYKFDPFNKTEARKAIGDYLSTLIDENGGDIKKALAAYGGFKSKDPTSYVNRALDGVTFGVKAPVTNDAASNASLSPKPQGAGVPFGMEESVKDNVKLAQDTYSKLSDANSSAPQLITALDSIQKYAPKAITGGLAEQRQLTNSITSLVPGWTSSMDAKTSTDLFNKAASRLVLAGTSSSSATDALRILAQAASPNSHMSLKAIQDATSQIKSLVQMNVDNQNILQQDKLGNNFNGVNEKHLKFINNADSRLWELKSMQPAERKAYWSKLSPEEQANLVKKGRVIQQLGGLSE